MRVRSRREYSDAYPPEVQRVVNTNNGIEIVHVWLRKIVKNRNHFPRDEAAAKLLYMGLGNIVKG